METAKIILKHRKLRATHQALALVIRDLKYTYLRIPGVGGSHTSNGKNIFEIRVGKNQPLEDIVITLSHEVGHALDYSHVPIELVEKAKRFHYKIDSQIIAREVAAWGYAQKILVDMNCYKHVHIRFKEIKRNSLQTYRLANLRRS